MENSDNTILLVDGSIPIVQNQLGLFRCFRIVAGYIFVILFIQGLVQFIFSSITSAIQIDVPVQQIAMMGNLLSRFFGLVAAGYFTFLMIRKYLPAPRIDLSFRQVGIASCATQWMIYAVISGIIFAIIFEYFLPRRYPVDPILLDGTSAQFNEGPALIRAFLLLITVGITPIVEEVFFRGFLHKIFSERLGKVTSALIVTTTFVLLHFQVLSYWVALVSLVVGSFTLILFREISNSLLPPILLHQIYNLGVAIFQ